MPAWWGTGYLTDLLGDQLVLSSPLRAVCPFVAMLAALETSSGLFPVPDDTIVSSNAQPGGDIFSDINIGEQCACGHLVNDLGSDCGHCPIGRESGAHEFVGRPIGEAPYCDPFFTMDGS